MSKCTIHTCAVMMHNIQIVVSPSEGEEIHSNNSASNHTLQVQTLNK